MVTVQGTYFLQGAQVTVGGNPATDVAVSNTNVLTVTVPSHGAGLVDVSVHNTDGQDATAAGAFTYSGTITFTDEPLHAGTTIKLAHLTELRQWINELRNRVGLGAFVWTDLSPTARVTAIKAAHVSEMRAALDAVYTAMSLTPPAYSRPVLVPLLMTEAAVDIAQLRTAVLAIY
jgi:hypothetical protein